MKDGELQFGEDFYWDQEGFMVFTATYLLNRGFCCHQGCRHCPYGEKARDAPDPLGQEPNSSDKG